MPDDALAVDDFLLLKLGLTGAMSQEFDAFAGKTFVRIIPKQQSVS